MLLLSDPLLAVRVQPQTLCLYRSSVSSFVSWVVSSGLPLCSADDLDGLLILFRRDASLSKSAFSVLLAALEFSTPPLKRQLPWARAVLAGLTSTHKVKHTFPLGWPQAVLLAVELAAAGLPVAGLCLLIQQEAGLRPSEVLRLEREDVLLGTVGSQLPRGQALLRLGKAVNTKIGREQCGTVLNSDLVALLAQRVRLARSRLFPFSYEKYRQLIRFAEARRGWTWGFTPHSPRAGFVSDNLARGCPPNQIQERGRWASWSSFRTYADQVAALAVSLYHPEELLLSAAAWKSRDVYFAQLDDSCPVVGKKTG